MRGGRQRWKERVGEGGFPEVSGLSEQSAITGTGRFQSFISSGFSTSTCFPSLCSLFVLPCQKEGEGPSTLALLPPRPSSRRDAAFRKEIQLYFSQHSLNPSTTKKQKTKKTRDALETCDALSGQGRASCFASFGIDSERVDAWYGPVSRLEAALNSHAGAGLCSFGDETEEEEEEEEETDDGGGDEGGGFRWPSLPGMPRW